MRFSLNLKIFRSYFLLQVLFICQLCLRTIYAQGTSKEYYGLDAKNYTYEVFLSDRSDTLYVQAVLDIDFLIAMDSFELDLYSTNKLGKGMKVNFVSCNGKKLDYFQYQEKLRIIFPVDQKGVIKIHINYQGIPKTGLNITNNMFGDRVFFADCWPNRAHHWLCCIDNPADKATVEFIVHAPSQYQVVSNGELIQVNKKANETITHWKTSVPIPTKVMVIGVAKFSVENYWSDSIPVSSWVYPQNEQAGFYDYSLSVEPLAYFTSLVGPYPYSKLANVQSTTEYGGMENAGCIFYAERSVKGDRSTESLIVHEIAHQWFGNTVTEESFHHIWLSEGFATYMTDLFIEQKYGEEIFLERLKLERIKAIAFMSRAYLPVIDTTLPINNGLLNPNNYDKAAWFLHMLRNRAGDEDFIKILQCYYSKFKYGNALTDDFLQIVDSVTGEDNTAFFQQWLYTPGHPVIELNWNYKQGEINLVIEQKQKSNIFQFPLEIAILYPSGKNDTLLLLIDKKHQEIQFEAREKPNKIILDPNTVLFFDQY